VPQRYRAVVTAKIALVRQPSSRLAEGLVTYRDRQPVDLALARHQHQAYVATLAGNGWTVREAPPAEPCPDSVFIEDTVVVCDRLAVLTRPGAPQRRPEVAGTAQLVAELGLTAARIEEPGTLDGGDVLQVDDTAYVGLGARTNPEGSRQLATLLAGLGRRVVPLPLGRVLHLKSVLTALPDGTLLSWPSPLDTAALPRVRTVREEAGCHVLPLGGDRVMIAASAPGTAELLDRLGYSPVVVDISEFEKLEGCVTCLSVLID
jgi:dimethylargininase